MELLFEIILGAFLIFFMVQTGTLSTRTVNGDSLTAKGFPMIIAGIALLFLIFIIVKKIIKIHSEGKKVFEDFNIPKQTLFIALTLLIYVIFINKIGFILCTIVYSYINARLLGYKKKGIVLIFAVGITIIFTLVFGVLFGVPLPRGTGFIKDLTYYIY